MKQSTIIITGMPRSGTSFTASVLQSAGLDIGQKLMAPGHGNIKGFFEDLDVVGFHETVLQNQGIHPVGWTLQEDIQVEESYMDWAKDYIAQHAVSSQWGWKDPRTTLFLNFWANLLPDAQFLFVYRAPWEVVDSLYRRGDELFAEEPELAIKVWIHYNQILLRFYDQFPERCVVASVYTVAGQTSSFINAINKRFGTDLVLPPPDLFEESLLHTSKLEATRPALVAQYFPEALQIYQELMIREARLGLAPAPLSVHSLETNMAMASAFRDWLTIRRLERKVKDLRAELEQAQVQLQQNQPEKEELMDSSLRRSRKSPQ